MRLLPTPIRGLHVTDARRSGVTTHLFWPGRPPGLVQLVARSGMRALVLHGLRTKSQRGQISAPLLGGSRSASVAHKTAVKVTELEMAKAVLIKRTDRGQARRNQVDARFDHGDGHRAHRQVSWADEEVGRKEVNAADDSSNEATPEHRRVSARLWRLEVVGGLTRFPSER